VENIFKVQFFSFVMGMFDWFNTYKINQALGSPKIDMLQFHPLEKFILF
jgi:hypothetical protein